MYPLTIRCFYKATTTYQTIFYRSFDRLSDNTILSTPWLSRCSTVVRMMSASFRAIINAITGRAPPGRPGVAPTGDIPGCRSRAVRPSPLNAATDESVRPSRAGRGGCGFRSLLCLLSPSRRQGCRSSCGAWLV